MNSWKKLGSALLSFLFCCIFMAGLVLIGMRAAGWKMLAVQTGSMSQTYPVGTLLIVDNSAPEKIEVGDVISYVANEHLIIVTHRVVEIDTENQYFYTKGDNNDARDNNPVAFDNLLGKVLIGIPYAGYAVLLIRSFWGKLIILVAAALIIIYIIWHLISRVLKKRREHRNAPSVESDQRK